MGASKQMVLFVFGWPTWRSFSPEPWELDFPAPCSRAGPPGDGDSSRTWTPRFRASRAGQFPKRSGEGDWKVGHTPSKYPPVFRGTTSTPDKT